MNSLVGQQFIKFLDETGLPCNYKIYVAWQRFYYELVFNYNPKAFTFPPYLLKIKGKSMLNAFMFRRNISPSGLPFKNVFLHGSYYITKWDCKTGEVSTVEYKVRGNKFTDIWMDEMAEPKTFTLNLNKTGQLQSRQDPNKPRLHSTKAVNKVTLVKLNLPPAYEDEV